MPAVWAGSQAGDGHHMPLQLPQHLQGLPAEHLPDQQSLAHRHDCITLPACLKGNRVTGRAAVQLSCFRAKAGSHKAACGSAAPVLGQCRSCSSEAVRQTFVRLPGQVPPSIQNAGMLGLTWMSAGPPRNMRSPLGAKARLCVCAARAPLGCPVAQHARASQPASKQASMQADERASEREGLKVLDGSRTAACWLTWRA